MPSLWQLKGYGKPIYLCAYLPHALSTVKSEIPKIDHSQNEIGIYRRSFELGEEFSGKELFISFGAVKAGFFLYINGHRVGYSQGSMTPAEFDITEYVKAGKNQITVEVFRYTDGTYLEDQDMFRYGGIFREVYLLFRAKRHIADISVKCTLSDDFSRAVFRAGISGSLLGGAVLRLLDGEGKDTGAAAEI